VAKGFPLWSERYDREMADIFDVQDEIARAIADKLKVTLAAGGEDRLVKPVTQRRGMSCNLARPRAAAIEARPARGRRHRVPEARR
jgi:hypothetical protein